MIPFVSDDNKLRWKFENLRNLNEIAEYSEKLETGPISWQINIAKKMTDGINYLVIYLKYSGENELQQNWFCRAKRTFELINQTGQNCTSEETSKIYDHFNISWGWSKFYKWDNLMRFGFMKNDSIIIEVDLSFKYYDFSKIPNLTDIILKIKDTEFHTSKAILCTQSEYFYDLFVNKNNTKTVIEIEDVEIADFRQFLASFYPHFDEIDEKNHEILWKLTEKFKVLALQRNCERFWLKNTEIKLQNAEKQDDSNLLKEFIESLDSVQKIRLFQTSDVYRDSKDSTKHAIIDRVLELID
ncbi:unnamed protein product [Caenorhabditis angaria]|uniref:BTB domain-containing protein n=1 Tax=Caenorhabditis angaria TaxID=860376 RepID=A0A9P1I951_9PELO|nr:unnamed protein product [Caenorhabditis angaria]